VNHDGAGRLAVGDRGAQRADGEVGGHAIADRVADDPVGEHVFDRAAVELPLGGGMLGDVGQPDNIGCWRREVPLDQVVVHRRTGGLPAALATLPGGGRPDPLRAADPPDPPFAAAMALLLELIGDEPVAELGGVLAKYAVARRRISTSISRRRLSRRSCTISDCSALVRPTCPPDRGKFT